MWILYAGNLLRKILLIVFYLMSIIFLRDQYRHDKAYHLKKFRIIITNDEDALLEYSMLPQGEITVISDSNSLNARLLCLSPKKDWNLILRWKNTSKTWLQVQLEDTVLKEIAYGMGKILRINEVCPAPHRKSFIFENRRWICFATGTSGF